MVKIGFLCLILMVKYTLQNEYLMQVVSNFFLRRHIYTITAATCWPLEVNEQLLKKLSAIDKSLSFYLLKSPTHATWYRHGFIVDLSCDRSLDFMQKITMNDRIFNLQNDWVLFNPKITSISNSKDVSTIVLDVFNKYLDKYYILPDSGVFLFQEIENNVWEIWSGFRASKLDVMRVFKIGMASNELIDFGDIMKQKTDFRGVELKTTTVILEPDHFQSFNQTTSSGLDIFTHMHYPMITILAYQLNFKFIMDITNDHGYSYNNGSFFGLTGILQREESDFGAVGSLMRQDKMTAIDYTIGTIILESDILFKQPKLSSITNIHIQPFRIEVWLMTLFTFIVFVSIIIFLNKFKAIQRQSSLTMPDIVGLVHGAICQQGSAYVLNHAPIRIVVFVLFLTALFLFNAYSATIVSLFQSTTDSIKSVKDILKEESMTMSIQISPFAKLYFKETTDSTLQKIYDVKIKPYENQEMFTNASMGIERIRTEFHGFMVEKTSAHKIINKNWREDEKCELYEIQLFKLPILAIPVPKNSGHKDVIKQKLIQQQEVGIKSRIVRQWITEKLTCDLTKKNRQYVSVSIKEILPTLKLFSYGLLISLLVFVLELVHNAYLNYVKNRQKAHRTLKMKMKWKY